MDLETAEALEGSIKKWERILDGTGVDHSGSNCPLCQLFSSITCEGCPVAEETQQNSCNGSPYEQWTAHHSEVHINESEYKIFCSICTRLAKDEVNFLKSLREN